MSGLSTKYSRLVIPERIVSATPEPWQNAPAVDMGSTAHGTRHSASRQVTHIVPSTQRCLFSSSCCSPQRPDQPVCMTAAGVAHAANWAPPAPSKQEQWSMLLLLPLTMSTAPANSNTAATSSACRIVNAFAPTDGENVLATSCLVEKGQQCCESSCCCCCCCCVCVCTCQSCQSCPLTLTRPVEPPVELLSTDITWQWFDQPHNSHLHRDHRPPASPAPLQPRKLHGNSSTVSGSLQLPGQAALLQR